MEKAGIRTGDLTRLKRLYIFSYSEPDLTSEFLQLENLQGLEYLNLGSLFSAPEEFTDKIAQLSEWHNTASSWVCQLPAFQFTALCLSISTISGGAALSEDWYGIQISRRLEIAAADVYRQIIGGFRAGF